MTWPPSGPGTPGGQPGQGDEPTQQYQGSYPTSPYQDPQPDPTQQYQGSYPVWDQQPQQPYQQGGYEQQPYPGQQYGQQYGQQGPGWPQPPRTSRTGLWVALSAIGLVVVLGAVIGVVLLTRGDDPPVADPQPSTSRSSTEQPSSTTSTTSTEPAPTSAGGAKPEPVVPGWQVVTSSKRKLAYDVPPGWQILDEETIIGFEDAEGPQVGMSGAAQLGRGFCAESSTAYRVGTGVAGYRDTDLALVATDAAEKWGRFGYLGPNDEAPTVDVGAAQQATIAGGQGARALAAVSGIFATPCVPPSATVHTAAFPSPEGGSYVFVIISDQGVPEGITPEQADQIIASIRFTG